MNSLLHLPRHRRRLAYPQRRNPNWLLRLARWIGKKRRLDALFYFHWLTLGKSRKDAWDAAQKTI